MNSNIRVKIKNTLRENGSMKLSNICRQLSKAHSKQSIKREVLNMEVDLMLRKEYGYYSLR